jgi:hypothetical protein
MNQYKTNTDQDSFRRLYCGRYQMHLIEYCEKTYEEVRKPSEGVVIAGSGSGFIGERIAPAILVRAG